MTDTFDHTISYGSESQPTFRVLRSQFGDGYSQRVPDGINNKVDKWSVKFDNIDDSEADVITEFFDSHLGSNSFYWTPPNGSQARYVCTTYTRTPEEVGLATISATFQQEFSP